MTMSRAKHLVSLAAVLAVLAAAAGALARDYEIPGVRVLSPWSRPAAAGGVGAGFAVIINTQATPVVLVSIRSPKAQKVELHQSVETAGVYSMTAFPDGVVIPANGRLELGPGGYHAMFVGLKDKLKTGQSLPATLTFRRGESFRSLKVEFSVQDKAPGAAP